MERKTVVAAASAISLSLVSAAIAIGANFGALGFAASSTPTVPPPSAVTTPARTSATPIVNPASSPKYSETRKHDGNEHEGSTTSAAAITASAGQTGGRNSDG